MEVERKRKELTERLAINAEIQAYLRKFPKPEHLSFAELLAQEEKKTPV